MATLKEQMAVYSDKVDDIFAAISTCMMNGQEVPEWLTADLPVYEVTLIFDGAVEESHYCPADLTDELTGRIAHQVRKWADGRPWEVGTWSSYMNDEPMDLLSKVTHEDVPEARSDCCSALLTGTESGVACRECFRTVYEV